MTLDNIVHEIRDFINNPRIHYWLIKDKNKFNQMCSSLDIIGDTVLAIEAYVSKKGKELVGQRYLEIYGLLQALQLQQDAVIHLAEALGLPISIKDFPNLSKIRDIRNRSVGHPTKKDRPKPTSYHFISRITLGKEGFKLESFINGDAYFEDILALQLIVEQKSDITAILTIIKTELMKRDKEHKLMFKSEKLEFIFTDNNLGHAFEKLNECFRGINYVPGFDSAGLETINKVLNMFQEALKKRDIHLETYDVIKYTYKDLEYPLAQLKLYINRQQCDISNKKEAHIYLTFVSNKVDYLKDVAKEIDAEYSVG